MSKRYITKPGGVILQHGSGESLFFGYGQKVETDELTDAQQGNIDRLTSSSKPDGAPDYDAVSLDQEHNINAAMADSGQPNSTSSPIPGNYPELSEDEAVRFVQGLEAHPKVQAAVIEHEQRNEGRTKVINAASDAVKAEAELRVKEASRVLDGLPDHTLSKADAKKAEEAAGAQGQDADADVATIDNRGAPAPGTPAPTS